MGLITTNEAKCRDCYRCIRTCPVKAIEITSNRETGAHHAKVIDNLCIERGCCILACPQSAKKLSTWDFDEVKKLLTQGGHVAAAVAPSHAAAIPLDDPRKLPDLLRRLGFSIVQETSIGAELVIRHHLRLGFSKPLIGSSCPVVVNIVERYYPELIPMLAPVVSPMVAHGRYIRSEHPGYHVVFIGPCVAKKAERKVEGIDDAVDYVLGFNELMELAEERGIDIESLKPAEFDNPPLGVANLFPLEGGMQRGIGHGLVDHEKNYVSLTGVQDCLQYLEHLATGGIKNPPRFMELLACRGGCIDGPLSLCREESIYVRRQKVLEYYRSLKQDDAVELQLPAELLKREYVNKKIIQSMPSENEIEDILLLTGKTKPEDELNCGACGYETCRDKAVAVYQGKAEMQMCIPYMRDRAESLSNVVMSAMPNGIIIVGQDLTILEMNSAAEKLFKCSGKELVGEKLAKLISPENYVRVLNNKKMMHISREYPEYGITVNEIIFPVEDQQIVVGIFIDITEERRHHEQFELMKNQTIMQAQEVIEKQMMVAQEIAGLLGEATAESKIHLSRLIKLMREDAVRKE
ncbi:[Fe-Fe] hydrogenase large subunit C-terminal domain-containing protein [Desulfofalx alkaliphila]|uniref:[Fe-Fe] hydrogenase large subunit C-terminal domain-containing protein n=1 Tax=Desulfofalx alkaliphila TaxID=105483 RepID=UPI0004E19B95|nr:[Fe-Fe] hydrogenase large subunit C-terminal domain-containing protein [Desulfofalx alkaliphila]